MTELQQHAPVDQAVAARAFWLREPGAGEIRACRAARAGARRGAGAHAALGRQPRHRDAGLPRRCAAEPVRRHAGAVPGGRLPGPGQVRLPQRRRGRGTGRPAARPHGVLPAPAPDGVRRAGRRGAPRARGRAGRARAVLAGTVETAVNALWDAAPLVGDRVAVVGAGMVGCCVARLLARHPRRVGDAGRRRSVPGRGRGGARRRLRLAGRRRPAAATWSCTPAPARPGCSARSSCSPTEGTVRRPQLVRRRPGAASLGGAFHSGRLADPRQPGRRRVARAPTRPPTTADRLALALELLRDPRVRRAARPASRRSRSCRT